jgi:hypothetical protein
MIATMSNVTTISSSSWTAMFDFEVEYPEEPDISQAYYRRRLLPRHEHGRHVRRRCHLRLGFSISAAPQALSFSYDGKTGLYRISVSGRRLLTLAGSRVVLAANRGGHAQL